MGKFKWLNHVWQFYFLLVPTKEIDGLTQRYSEELKNIVVTDDWLLKMIIIEKIILLVSSILLFAHIYFSWNFSHTYFLRSGSAWKLNVGGNQIH